MDFDSIFHWILSHPQNYPGKHLLSQPRTLPIYKPLEARSQFHLILKATSEYIKENMESGKGVNIRGFGAFSFEVGSEAVKPAQLTYFDISKELQDQRMERRHVHKIRPCFVPDIRFKGALSRYAGKEEITAPKSQHSIYQKGFQMIFCNPGPVAAACFLGKDLVSSALEAFFKATIDLTELGRDLVLDFKFCKITIQNKDIRYSFKKDFCGELNQPTFETRMRKADPPTSSIWKTTYEDKWNQSTLKTLIKRPNSPVVKNYYEKTLALKIMSLDLNTSENTKYSRTSNSKLPQIKQSKRGQSVGLNYDRNEDHEQ